MRIRLICVALAATVTAAHADDELAEARRLQAALDYDRALALVEATLARGGADPTRLAELHLLAGELTAGLERQAAAEDHFARALALRPDVALAAGTSPKLTTPLEAARARTTPLRVHATASAGVIAVIADDDRLGLVVGVSARIVDARGVHGEVVARAATRVALPAGAVAIEIAALDASGNRAWIGAPPADVVAPPPPPPSRESPSLLARPLPWAIATVALAAAGGALAWKTSSLQADWNALRRDDGAHDYSQLTALEHRGKDYAIAADVAFGVAAIAAVATTVLYLRAPTYATIVATPTSAALTARFSW